MLLKPGTTLGPYSVTAKIGEGGMGEVFLAATSAGVWPVISVDDRKIGDGTPGAVTSALKDRLAAIARGEDSRFRHWLDVL